MRQTTTSTAVRTIAIEKPECSIACSRLEETKAAWESQLADEMASEVPRPDVVERLECRVGILNCVLKHGACFAHEVREVGKYADHTVSNAFTYIRRLLRNWALGIPSRATA